MEWPHQIDHQYPLPIVIASVVEGCRGDETGSRRVVDQQIEPAECLGIGDHRPNGQVVGDIGLEGQPTATQSLDIGHGLLGVVAQTRVIHQHRESDSPAAVPSRDRLRCRRRSRLRP